MGRPFIVVGDKTSHGGTVCGAAATTSTGGRQIARVGDPVSCPKDGHGTEVIITGDSTIIIEGKPVARHGDKTSCGATLISSQSATVISNDSGTTAGQAASTAAQVVSPPAAGVSAVGEAFAGEDPATDEHEADDDTTWQYVGIVVGYGKPASVTIPGPGRVKVVAMDAAASPHMESFAYDLTITPIGDEGAWMSPVYHERVMTGAYGAIGTEKIYPGSATDNYERWRWTFEIKRFAHTHCANCGAPSLEIYYEPPQ